MEITEKVAYIKGLMEGLGIEDSSKEGKMFKAIVDLLDDIALSVSDLEDSMVVLSDQMDSIDEDLEDLQGDLYDDDEDDEFEGELYEVTCPACGDTICIDEDMLDEGEIDCPNCGETLEFDLDGTLEDCGCDCGHDHSHE